MGTKKALDKAIKILDKVQIAYNILSAKQFGNRLLIEYEDLKENSRKKNYFSKADIKAMLNDKNVAWSASAKQMAYYFSKG